MCIALYWFLWISIDFRSTFDFFWQSLSLVQLTAHSFTKASRKLHEMMLPAHSPRWKLIWGWISNCYLWISIDFRWISIDFLCISMDFVRTQLLCIRKHCPLKLIANFVLDFAGIATGLHEIHNVFNQKMMTKWLCKVKSEVSLSMSDLLHATSTMICVFDRSFY